MTHFIYILGFFDEYKVEMNSIYLNRNVLHIIIVNIFMWCIEYKTSCVLMNKHKIKFIYILQHKKIK